MARWETHRGDEWWYSDHAIEARAARNDAFSPPVFLISTRSRTANGLDARSLLRLLRLTREQMPEFELWCSLDHEMSVLLSDLAAQGLVRWELIEHPHSRDARIVDLAQNA